MFSLRMSSKSVRHSHRTFWLPKSLKILSTSCFICIAACLLSKMFALHTKTPGRLFMNRIFVSRIILIWSHCSSRIFLCCSVRHRWDTVIGILTRINNVLYLLEMSQSVHIAKTQSMERTAARMSRTEILVFRGARSCWANLNQTGGSHSNLVVKKAGSSFQND